MKAWLASDLSELDLLVIQIDGLHVGDHVLMAAIGVDGNGDKHVLAVVEGATENTVVVQALIDNLLARGLDPTLPRLFIVDGAKALSKAIRNTFGVDESPPSSAARSTRAVTASSACPNICTRASRRRSVRPGTRTTQTRPSGSCATWSGRLEHEEPGVSGSILEGLEEILTVIRLGLPHGARSPAPTSSRTRSARCARSPATLPPRWRSDGPPPACWRPRKPSVASYRQLPSSEMLSRNT